ncbi:DUF5977 domain-containing protein [Pedobacter agri]|uniref:DUF5977 domain-containing protein n=1 Tax=Pedobacter agri TaxID=454586 RepID=A0A9X3DET0_9SPHI|nr:DUF5977 domain-containing protein [Pedobacter agri]MCX3264816.1 DUF5977 domain-containing protein [Pedobacter agri]
MQINRFNFIRWFTNQSTDQTINIPRLSARQSRVYCPVIALGEAFSFYVNADIPFSDSDNLQLDLVGTAGTFTNVSPLSKDVIPNNGGYNIFCNGTLNGIPTGQYQLVIKVGAIVKCISNPIQVMNLALAERMTVSVLYRNSRTRSRFRYFENPTFRNKIRLTVSLVDWTAEGNLEQYREVSTGTLRNEKLELDRKIKISTYFFDDGAHEAMTELGVCDSIIINGRNYRAKGIYSPTVRESANVSKGEIELYEVDFSKINKYGKMDVVYQSDAMSAVAQKNNCTSGTGSMVTYSIPAGKHTSTISQADANAKAQADLDNNKQSNANQKGTCIPPKAVVINYTFEKGDNPTVDMVLVPSANGNNLGNVYGTSFGSLNGAMVGDNLNFAIVHEINRMPWPAQSRASLIIEKNGIEIYSSGFLTDGNVELLASKQLIAEDAVYTVKCVSISTSTAYIGLVLSLYNQAGLTDTTPLFFRIDDNTSGEFVLKTRQDVNVQENIGFNALSDGNTLKATITNGSPFNLTFTVFNDYGYSESLFIASGQTGIINNNPKTALKIKCNILTTPL